MRMRAYWRILLVVAGLVLPQASLAGPASVSVAVAANFADAAKALGARFTAETGIAVGLSPGATGALFTQIAQGAPFEIFLAADSASVQKVIDAGLAVADSRFTYAVGRLVLFSADPALVTGSETLTKGNFDRLAIASPGTAPYGAAAVAAMRALGTYAGLKQKLVVGASIAQAYQFVETGNAELGFVALSQVVRRQGGSRWQVPQALYPPLTQDAVLLAAGETSASARAFMAFLRGPEALRIIASYGYGTAGTGG